MEPSLRVIRLGNHVIPVSLSSLSASTSFIGQAALLESLLHMEETCGEPGSRAKTPSFLFEIFIEV